MDWLVREGRSVISLYIRETVPSVKPQFASVLLNDSRMAFRLFLTQPLAGPAHIVLLYREGTRGSDRADGAVGSRGGDGRTGAAVSPAGRADPVNGLYRAGLIVALGLLAYLVYALLKPEKLG